MRTKQITNMLLFMATGSIFALAECTPGKKVTFNEAAIPAVRTVAILPVVIHIKNETIDREFMQAAQLAGIEATPLSEEMRPNVEKEFLLQLQKQLPADIRFVHDIQEYLEVPVTFDSISWNPKWKTGIDSVPFDAVIGLEVTINTRTRVNARCTAFLKSDIIPLTSANFVPRHKKEFYDSSSVSGPIFEAIKQTTKKFAQTWQSKRKS